MKRHTQRNKLSFFNRFMMLGSKLFIKDFDSLSNDLSFFTCVLLNDGFSKLQYDNAGRTVKLKTSYADLFVKRYLIRRSVFSGNDTFLWFLSNWLFKFSELFSSTPSYLYEAVTLIVWWLYMTSIFLGILANRCFCSGFCFTG